MSYLGGNRRIQRFTTVLFGPLPWMKTLNISVSVPVSYTHLRAEGITYNRFIQGLHLAGIELDRRALAELAISDPETFKAIVEQAKAALPADVNAPKEA